MHDVGHWHIRTSSVDGMRGRFTIYSAFLDIKKKPDINKSFLDIKKLNLISRNQILDIKQYLINSKTAPQNIFLDIKKSISCYQEFDLIRFSDIKKWQYFLISKIRFSDIKNSFLDIKKCNC